MKSLIGRDPERAVVATFVAAAASESASLIIEGEPGIGKTALFRYAVDLARASGSIVLECSPTVAESKMGFAGLTDLLRGIPSSTFESLPAPQRQALAVATLRETPSSEPHDERVIGTGLAALLTHLATSGPIVLAIDDLPWLDRSSADAIMFAVRRLTSERLGVLTASRTGELLDQERQTLSQLAWSRELAPGGLSSAALFHIVRDRLDLALTRPVLTAVTDTSGGNPFAALELARATSGGVATRPKSSSGWLQALTAARLGQLSAAAREAMLAAACSSRPTRTMLDELGLVSALEEAEADGTVMLDDDRVMFAHPLLAAAVVDMSSPAERRAMHARLAGVASDVESRARHQAMARPGVDELTAASLDEAAKFAQARGSAIAAVELAKLALDRTVEPDGDLAWQRRITLAEFLHAAGATGDAGLVLSSVSACPAGALRARALLVLTEVAWQTGTAEEAVAHASAALAESHDSPEITVRCLLTRATVTADNRRRSELATEAKSLIDSSGLDHPLIAAWAECEGVAARFGLGEGLDRASLDHALAAERTGRDWRSTDQVAAIRPALLKWADHEADALASLQELRARAEDEGNEGLLPYVLGHVPGTLLRLGRFHDAAAAAAEHLDLAELTGQSNQRVQAWYNVALVDAHLGRLDEARVTGRKILDWTGGHPDEWLEMSAAAVLGFTALSAGDTAEARQWFDRWFRAAANQDLVDPGVTRFYGDHIEALVACGAIDEATEKTRSLELRARRSGRTSASAIAERCWALIRAAEGDVSAALGHVEASLALDDVCPSPFERLRTVLLQGMIHRRNKEKALARRAIVLAAEGFAVLGAMSWEQRCTSELARIGTRTTASSALTVTEHRIAELAATGLTTKQMAEKCFISPKTVEANLTRIYQKLAISSRAELGARMQHYSDPATSTSDISVPSNVSRDL